MAANQKEIKMGGDEGQQDNQQDSYEQKFQEMQKYIPFLEMMIQRLERSSDKSREAQLLKMKSLHSILLNTKRKLKIETLKRCEEVLQKLHDKVEKGSYAQAKHTNIKHAEERIINRNSQESTKPSSSDNADFEDGSDQHLVTSSTDASSVTDIMKSLKLAAARASGKAVSSTTSCPVYSSDLEDSRDAHSTTSNCTDNMSSSEKKSKTLDVLEQSRERLKKLMEQQTPSSSTEATKKSDGCLGSPSMEWQYQADPPWENQAYEGTPKYSYPSEPEESSSNTKPVKDISSSEGPQDDDELCTGWSDYKSPTKYVWSPDSNRHLNTIPNKPPLSPTGFHSVPPSLHSPRSPLMQQSFATNSSSPMCKSPIKRSVQKSPTLCNVLKHPPALGTKPLSDADIEELLEDTSRSELELEKKEESAHMSLRAKLEQEIQQVHRVGVSKGGALRSLVQKDDKLKSPVRNILDMMKPNSELKKDKSLTNRLQLSSKLDSAVGSFIKSNEKEKGNDMGQNRQSAGSNIAEKDDKSFGIVKDTSSKPTIKDKKPTDPRRRASVSPRREDSFQNTLWEDLHSPAEGENSDSCISLSADLKSNYDDPRSINRDLSVLDKFQGTTKKESGGILSSLSKEELQKIVEDNLRNLPSPPPNTKEILENVGVNSSAVIKPARQQPTDLQSPVSSPKDCNQSGLMSPLHSSQYGSQAESHLAIGRNSMSSSSSGVPRPEDRRPLLPTPNLPHDPRILSRNLNQGRRCSRDNQGPLSNIHDPRLNTSSYPHLDNYRSGILPQSPLDQYMRPVSNAYHQGSRTLFHTSQTPHLQSHARWTGSQCYGVLSHSSPRPPDESFVHHGDSFLQRGPNNMRFQCPPLSSQHEFSPFQGQIRPLRDTFSVSQQQQQQHSPWQSPPSSQGCYRGGSSANYPSFVRSVGQPVQHHGNSSHNVGKIPVGVPRMSNSHFTGHRSPVPPQSMSAASVHGSGGPGTLGRAQSVDGRIGNTLSERDPRRRSIEEPEKRDCNLKSNRDMKISSSSRSPNYGSGPERITDRHSSNERRRDSESKRFESSSSNRRRNSPEPNKPKETELVSPLNSLYDVTTVPKTGKGYGFQKFRIPKIKRPPSPPKSKSPPPPKAKSPPPKLESSSCTVSDTKEKVEVVKPIDETPVTQNENQQANMKDDDVCSIDRTDDDRVVMSVISKNNESTSSEKTSDTETPKTSSGSRSKDGVTQEWIEALIRKSIETGEGKKFVEQAKVLEKLGESLKGKKLRKIKQILESDSDSGSNDNTSEFSKKNENTCLNEEDQKMEEKGKLLNKEEISVELKKSKYRRLILSDDDQSSDNETLDSKLKKILEVDRQLSTSEDNHKVEEVESSKVDEQKKQTASSDEAKPARKYSKRRSALELLQEDIRDMFICEGVVTATGHRMCRLLKETPPGMTVDEISKSTIKRTEDEVSTTAEESDGSSVIGKRRPRKLPREKGLEKKGKEEKVDKKQRAKMTMKDEEEECSFEKGCGDISNEMDEKMTNSRVKKKDDGLIYETGDSSGFPCTKSNKKCGKSKWKGYVIEESEDSGEETAVDKVRNSKKSTGEREESESCDKSVEQSCSHPGIRTRSKLSHADESETSNSERGRRTRSPRVILEKTDITKLNLMSSSPRTKYFEDSSSDESVMEDSTSSPVSSGKSKFKVAQKPRSNVKYTCFKRKRGRPKKGEKKQAKIERIDEVSTDVESIVSDQSSVASTLSHRTNWCNMFTPIGFTFRRKCNRKRSKLLGKKIDDIINRLTKDADGFKTGDATVNTPSTEEKLCELGTVDSSVGKAVAEIANVVVNLKESIIQSEDRSKPATSSFNVPVVEPKIATEITIVPSVTKRRNSRIMLNLVRKSGIQRKVKKKKAKWQLGIINNHAKKKGGPRFVSEVGMKYVACNVTCEKEVDGPSEVVHSSKLLIDECSGTENGESEVSINEGKEERNMLLSSRQNITVNSDDKLCHKIEMKQISETEDNKMHHKKDILETSNICTNKLDEMVTCSDSEKYLAKRDKLSTIPDRSYALDGSARYACKLCPAQCKGIVTHYRNSHPDSEVLISRLPEEKATRAISEALESKYIEEEEEDEDGNVKTGKKKKKKQAGEFVCRICDHVATFPLNFYDHLSSHTGEYRFQCGKCSFEACTKHSVKGHSYYHHPELKGVKKISATVLTPGPPNNAKFVFGYLCSSCNYVQLLKQNIEKHISLRHPSEDNARLICINMSKMKSQNDTAEGTESKDVCTDVDTNESNGSVTYKLPLVAKKDDGDVCNVALPVTNNEMIPEEDIKRPGSIVTGQKPEAEHIDMTSKPCEALDEGSMKKEQESEIEPLQGVCQTHTENTVVSSCIQIPERPEVIAVDEDPGTISQELSAVNSVGMTAGAGGVKSSDEVTKEDLMDTENIHLKQNVDDTGKNDTENTVTASSLSVVEEAVKEVDLKAFVCCDDLEEENSVIQKERLKKMQEIAKNLKDSHPKFLQSNRSSILDQLSDKLKTCLKSKSIEATMEEINDKAVDSVTHSKVLESKESKSEGEKSADVSTLIDEKRAIEAAQAVQNLLRAEKETIDDKQSNVIGQKVTESQSGSKSGRNNKPCTGDSTERRITRSFSRNEDDVETVDESSSDISFGFEGEDNEDVVESESQIPDNLLNDTLSALKDVCPRKSTSRMFDIIERLASKVVPNTEPGDLSEHVAEIDNQELSSSVIAGEHVRSNKVGKMKTNEADCLKIIANKKLSAIGKPPPLISLGAKGRNMLQVTSGIGSEGSDSSVRVGPLEVKRFSEGLLYSCCIRGCIFASTNRTHFANHIENTHRVCRWDGSCKACNIDPRDQYFKLSYALHHLIRFHLVADLTASSAVSGNGQYISILSTEKTYAREREVSEEETCKGNREMSIERIPLEQGAVLTKNTFVGGAEKSISSEGVTECSAPRKFIRLRRLSGDLLSIPKPAEDPVITDVQQQGINQDDTEVNQLFNEVLGEEMTNNEEDCGPFLRIESVVSLNPDAMGSEDVNDILRAVEDPQNSSKSSENSDSGNSSNVSSSSNNIYSIPGTSCAISVTAAMTTSVIESSVPFITTSVSSTSVEQTSSPDVQLLTSSPLPLSVLRGKGPRPQGTMHMIPINPLSKSSTITILPSLQQLSPMKFNNVQLSPVKLSSCKPSDIAPKPSVSTNIPHSLVCLAQITRPTNSKVTVAKERLSAGVLGGGVWCNQLLPNILPKGTFVRLEIKDNQVKTKSPVMLTTKSQAPVMVNMKTMPSLTMTTKTTSVAKAPISSTSVKKRLEIQVPSAKILQKAKPSFDFSPPSASITPASNTVLSTVVSKSKLPHKSAIAPSYAKASKVPIVYQRMIKPIKLRHLYKCMSRLCSYTTDFAESFTKHYYEHEDQAGQRTSSEKRKGRPPAVKLSDWQQCAYCCVMHISMSDLLEHIQTEHGHCLYQCAYCFYRAVSKSYIVLHQNTSHTSEHVAVLMCKKIRNLPNPVNLAKPRSSVVVPYICEQGNCGAVFYISDHFLYHLEKEHSQLAIYSCHICESKSFKSDRLLAHYKLHSCCFYQCLYCLHGTDTKEEMHHHLCNFHSNQLAKVIIRSSSISKLIALRGKQNNEDLLNALDLVDLDEGLSDDGLLILPPPDMELTSEDPSLSSNVKCSELDEHYINENLNVNTGMTPKETSLDNGAMNAVSAISSELHIPPTELLLTELSRKGSNKLDSASMVKTSKCGGNDAKSQNSNPSTKKSDEKTDDDVVVIDDDEGNDDISHTQPISQQNSCFLGSNTVSEIVCLQSNGTHPSQSDSDIECLEEHGKSQEGKKLNDTQDSDVVVLDTPTETVGQVTDAVGKHSATQENTHLFLHEPLVTVKHRNPKTTAAIEAAVDPLSFELPQNALIIQNKDESPSITSSLQNISSISVPAENPGLDSKNANSVFSTVEANQNESGVVGVEHIEDAGLSGSMLYQCGYVTCTFSAENSSLLKDHLLVCDLARASSSLTCVHCKKPFKYVSSLLEHLRTHGTRRIGCALCSFRAPVPHQVVKHLKQRHRVGSTRVVPLDPLRTDPETAVFVVFPKEKGKGGRSGKGSGKDTHDVRNKLVFLPEELELLPRQAIYTRPVRCATCSYTTKVRSNMARHLHLHLTSSTVPDVVPPNTAPVNPVPCLEKKEMMFDKMTNLAASSHIAAGSKVSETPSGSLTLTEELQAKLPRFVPEHQRYVCGAPGCNYLTCDETMLRYHLRALHFDETAYRCPHCPESALQENAAQIVSIERMGAHLKMHDSRLYKCLHCMYYHFQRYVVERHLADKHPEKRPFVHIVREPEMESSSGKTETVASTSLEGGGSSSDAGTVKNPWHCGLCKFHCSTRSEVLEHTWNLHGLKSQFKCGLCSYRSSSKCSFDNHFASKHPAVGNVELIHVYRKVDGPQTPQSPAAKSGLSLDTGLFDTTPLWRRDMQRVRHIRGILLEEEGDVPKPDIVRRTSVEVGEMEEKEGKFGPYGRPVGGNLYFCTLCNKYRTKFKADFRDHLYRELKYHKWVCTHCSLMSCNRSSLQKHSSKVHERDRKPEAIAPLTPNKEIEEWVEKVISTQFGLMRADQQAALAEASNSSCKTFNPIPENVPQPGPSGLSGRASKTEHSITGSDVKFSLVEKEDINSIGSTSSDSDIGTSKKKVPGLRDAADSIKVPNKTATSLIPVDSNACDSSPYIRMKATKDDLKLLRFPCKHCNMKFALIRGLKLHIRHSHLKLSIWTCGHCGYVANSEESVLNHNKVDHPDLPPRSSPHTKGSCVKLDDEFWQREYGLGPGSESKYLNMPFTAASSSASSSLLGSPLKKRQRIANSPDESEGSSSSSLPSADQSFNTCLYCDYCCRSASDLKYHMMRHWVQKPFKCGYCDFEGVREYEIKKHSAKIHPLKKLRVIEKPIPSQPDIRPLQRNRRSKPDISEPSDDSEDIDVVSTVNKVEEEQQNTTPLPNIFCCFYCPQRGTSVVSIHQHWQEKHKNKLIGPSGLIRQGLPFKYKEVNMKQFLKGQNGAAGRRPALQCSYCKVRGTLAMLQAHQKSVHPEKPFQVNQATFTRYECAECHFSVFTVNTLKKHFDMDHAGKDLRYLVRSSKANFTSDLKGKDLLVANISSASSILPTPAPVVTAKYMCLWCKETCDSEDIIQVHHAMCHSHLQLRYSVEKSSTPTVTAKKYSCLICTFTSDNSQSMSEHVQQHARPYKYAFSSKTLESSQVCNEDDVHLEKKCKVVHVEDAEKELEKLRSDIGVRVGGECGMKRESEACDASSSPKRLCVARKSTTLFPRVGKFHAVARKSTNPLLSQTTKMAVLSSCCDVEQEDTSTPSSRCESPLISSEFSYYGCRPAPVDTNRITASVKLRNNLGVNMNVSLATMERFTNMYPVVKVKDLKYEKWGFL